MTTIRLSADQNSAVIPPVKAVRVRRIKPCPFCGAKAIPYALAPRDYMQIQHAPKCYFRGAHLFIAGDDGIPKWNRRAKNGKRVTP
jgi:hypothetical protein